MKEYEQKIINIIDNLKAECEAEYERTYREGYATGYDHGKRDGYKDGKADTPFTDTEEAENKAYHRGLAEAWDAARTISVMSNSEQRLIFNEGGIPNVLGCNTASEAIAKIRAYEDKQKQDAEIKVGDEVYSEEDGLTFIVTRIKGTEYEGICTDGACYNGLPDDIVETGRHFPQIVEVLAELRGAENDE